MGRDRAVDVHLISRRADADVRGQLAWRLACGDDGRHLQRMRHFLPPVPDRTQTATSDLPADVRTVGGVPWQMLCTETLSSFRVLRYYQV